MPSIYTPPAAGQQTKSQSLPVVLASDTDPLAVTGAFYPATQPVSGTVSVNALPAGTNVIGHVIVDSAGNVAITSLPALPAGSALIGHVIADTGSTTAVTSLPALPAGTAVIGHVIVDSAGAVSITSLPALPAGTNVIGHVIADTGSTTAITGTVAVTGTFWQATQPVSAGSLPLPAGAATAAKQPALGTAGTASADVLSVQGAAAMTALKVDGSAVTQPVSGVFYQATQPVSGTVSVNALPAGTAVIGHVIVDSAGAVSITSLPSIPAGTAVIGHVIADTGSTTAVTSLPALPAGTNVIGHVIVDSAGAVSITSLPSLPAGTAVIGHVIADSGSTTAITGTVAVSGTFWQATQPVSGTFWQATQPVSGTFWQTTQPVSTTALPAALAPGGGLKVEPNAALYNTDFTLLNAVSATGTGNVLDLSGIAAVGLTVSGIFVGTITWECNTDGGTWVACPMTLLNGGTQVLTTTAPTSLRRHTGGLRQMRANLAWTSGTSVTVTAHVLAGGDAGQHPVALNAKTTNAGDTAVLMGQQVMASSLAVALASDQTKLTVEQQTYTAPANGEIQGATSATQFPSVVCKLVRIKAAAANTGKVYVGKSGVTKIDGTTDTTSGLQLSAGDDTGWLPLDNLNRLYYIMDGTGDGVQYLCLV